MVDVRPTGPSLEAFPGYAQLGTTQEPGVCPALWWGRARCTFVVPAHAGWPGWKSLTAWKPSWGPWSLHSAAIGASTSPRWSPGFYAVNDLANKPPGTFGEHDGASNWPRLPRAKRELVDVVTCLFTEKPSQTDIGSPKRVEDYQIGCGRDVECPVELRDAHVPAQRTNAALRSEAHEAAGPAFIARYCEHVHRVVQMGDETTVGFLVLAVQFGSYPVHDASVLLGLLYVLILPFPVLSSILFAACSSRWKMVSVPTPVGPAPSSWPSG